MPSLEKLKDNFNPYSVKPSAELRSNGATGVPAIAEHVFTGIDNIQIEGDVTLAEGVVVQRGSSLIANPGRKITIAEAAPIMDHVEIHATNSDIRIGTHVTVAHGSHLHSAEGTIDIADGGFVNINVRANGGTVKKDGYVGPGLVLTNSDEIGQGEVHFHHPHVRAAYRTIGDNPTATGTKLINRANIKDVSRQLHNKTGEPLTIDNYPGYQAYTDAIQHLSDNERSRQQNLPFENWLRQYSLRQLGKAAAHMANEAQLEGAVIWHSTALQSDILHLSKIRDILQAADHNDLAASIGHLIKAEAYLIGIYQPTTEEKTTLNHAFDNAGTILQQTGEALGRVTAPLSITSLSKESAASAASGLRLADATEETYTLSLDDIAKFHTRLATIGERATSISSIPLQEKTGQSIGNSREINQVAALRSQLNKRGVNIRQLPDAPHIKSYYGAIPVISDAILVGKVDLVGNVRIDSGAIIEDSTIRTEQRMIPVYIGKEAIIEHTIVHTAGREQTPVEVGEKALIHGQERNKVVLHGPYIGPESYVGQGAVVADEVLLQGVVLPKAVVDGVTTSDSWEVYGGNISNAALIVDAKITRKLGYDQLPDSLRNPDILDRQEATKPVLDTIRDAEKTRITNRLEEKVSEYGDIYSQSAHLQVELLSLQIASSILEQTEKDSPLVSRLKNLQEGYEYLLGVRDTISQSAATLFINSRQVQRTVAEAGEALNALTAESIEFPLWPKEAENGIGRAEVYKVLYDTIHPSFKEASQEATRHNIVEAMLPQHASLPKLEIEQRLIPNLGKVAERIASLSAAKEQRQQAALY